MGIARLAAAAPREAAKNEVEYFRLRVRTVLNRVDSRRVGFGWSINPYRGCEFGCQYCYARYTHTYMELDPTQFENKIYVKAEAARILRRDLTPEKVLGEHIAIGAATDPYQPAERQFGVTRAILETLLEFSRTLPSGGLSLSITTKSNLVLRDLDLLRELAGCSQLQINVSVGTLNARLARALEPRAPRPDLRLETVRQLAQAGITTGVFAMPILPGLTDKPAELEALVAAAADARAHYLCAGVAFLMPSSQRTFFPFLERKFPRLVKQYHTWYRRNGYAPQSYRKEISTLMAGLRRKYRLPSHPPDGGIRSTQDPAAPLPNYSALTAQLAIPFAS
ncbi:MAG: radical SAM protein [Acidobacteria bacterium]|nr:radical SAM protein [Acidobacteriota bacterium]